MPYAFDTHHKKLPRTLDRRVKITDEYKEQVKWLHKQGVAQRQISRDMGISRRMISFIIYPERYIANAKQFAKRRKDGRYYPGKKKWASIMREHRNYKQSLKDKLL